MGLANAAWASGDLEAAADGFRQVLANAAWASGDLEAAADGFRQVLAIAPGHAQARAGLASVTRRR